MQDEEIPSPTPYDTSREFFRNVNITVNELIYCKYLEPNKLVVIDPSDDRIKTPIIHFINLLEGYIKQLDELKSEPITIIHELYNPNKRYYEPQKQSISRDLQVIREDLKQLILAMQRKHPYKYYPIPEEPFDDFDFEFRDTEIDHRELISYKDAVKLIVALATSLKAKLEVPIGRINQFTYEFFEAEPAYDLPEWRGFIVADESDFDTQDSIIPTEKQTIDKFGDISPRGESYDCQDNDESLEGGQEVGNSARKQIKNLRQEPNSIGFLEGCIPKSQPIREEELQKTPADNRSKSLQQSDKVSPADATLNKGEELQKTPANKRSKSRQTGNKNTRLIANWCNEKLVDIIAKSKSPMSLSEIYDKLTKLKSKSKEHFKLPKDTTISKYLRELSKKDKIKLGEKKKKYSPVPTQVAQNETEV